jgi:hypothetical protein
MMCQVPFRLVLLRPPGFAITLEDSAAAAAPASRIKVANIDADPFMA